MKLSKVTIYKYKSFLTEQTVDIEPDITRIVGKNESGKSALLEAVAKTRYFDEKDTIFKFDKDLDYPRSQLIRARKENPEAVRCEYTLSDDEIEEIEDYFAPGILKSRTFGLTTKYDGGRTVDGFDENFDVFKTWLGQLDKSKGIMGQLKHLNGNKAFNHYAPSRYMMAHIGELQFSDNTLNAFEEVFKAINKLLK